MTLMANINKHLSHPLGKWHLDILVLNIHTHTGGMFVQPSTWYFTCNIVSVLTEQHLNLFKKKKKSHMYTCWNSECNSCFTCNRVTKVMSDTTDLLVLLAFTHVQDFCSPRVECTYSKNVECNEEREMHKRSKGKECCSLFSFLAVK